MSGGWLREQSARHREALERELGEVILGALGDGDVTEVMLNADGELWLDHRSRGLVPAEASMSAERARGLISTIAGLLGRVVGEASPILEAELPLDGSRIEAVLPPVAEAPAFAIRKRASQVIPLERYLSEGVLTPSEADVLRAAVRERWNVVISGGPGSGKTTFANALLHEMGRLAETERVVILEDTFELRCSTPNHLILHTSEAVDLRRLVHAALRLRPDRLVVGEVRGAEALELLKAWNTGNPGGLATVHANNAEMALERLDQLAQEAGVPSRARLVAQTVDVVVHLERRGSVRRVRQLVSVEGHDQRGFVVDEFFPEIEIKEVEK